MTRASEERPRHSGLAGDSHEGWYNSMKSTTKTKFPALAATAALATLVAFSATPPALADTPQSSLEALAVELVDTPAQHAALANYFRAQAAEARANAKRHTAMKAAYSGGKLVQARAMATHCDKLIEDFTAAATEYESLAAEHDKLAGK